MTTTNTIKALRDALTEALSVITDYLEYEHNGDPWTEDARTMGEMEIDDYQRDGRMDAARSALALTADASEDAPDEPVRYEMRMCAPNGHKGEWRDASDSAYAKFSAQPDIGDGFTYETRALFCHAAPSATLDQSILLTAVQCLCIAADQEWCRQEGKLSEWDQGWFKGQLHVLDLYTGVDKSAIAQAREYIEKLCLAARPAPVAATPAPDVAAIHSAVLRLQCNPTNKGE